MDNGIVCHGIRSRSPQGSFQFCSIEVGCSSEEVCYQTENVAARIREWKTADFAKIEVF